MFPIPEERIPLWIRRHPSTRILLLACLGLVFISLLFQEVVTLKRELVEGPRLSELNKKVAHDLLDSAAVGLERFHIVHGRYPSASGKYFLDSIRQFINCESIKVYICADTISESGQIIVLREGFDDIHPIHRFQNTYLGVGHPSSLILYQAKSPNSYRLYWIGENQIDEGGEGDDIRY
jgi:hypothetical protein